MNKIVNPYYDKNPSERGKVYDINRIFEFDRVMENIPFYSQCFNETLRLEPPQ